MDPILHGTGAKDDPRSAEEKAKDYKSIEVMTPRAPSWVEKGPAQWRSFEIFDQDGSSSCVGQATAKILGIEQFREEGKFLRFSARDIYSRRANTDEGMWFQNALEIASKHGATLESMMPSEKLNEAQMNITTDRKPSTEQVAKIFRAGGYVGLPIDIDAIADVISRGKGILLGFRFNYDEWDSVPHIATSTPGIHHGVAGMDFGLFEGKQTIIIEDSWGNQSTIYNGRRVITNEFLKARCTFAGYLIDLSNNWRDFQSGIPRPKVRFDVNLSIEQTSNEVKKLQDVLKYEELFPVNVESTGYYGNLTAKGVLAWQKRYRIASDAELDALGGKMFGPASRSRANQLYPLM